MRRIVLAALIFLAIGPVPMQTVRYTKDNFVQQASARPLEVLPASAGTLRFVRGWQLMSPHSRFGGFSAVARLGPDGVLLLGDNGYATRMRLDRSGELALVRIAPLPVPDGRPDRKPMVDSESLFVDPDTGSLWVGLERTNQLWRFDEAMSRLEARFAPAVMRDWPKGRGPEAMVRLADGRVVIFAEGGRRDPRSNRAVMLASDPGAVTPPPVQFYYDSEGKGAVSDAALLPDGRILLVHRHVGWSPIFTSTIAIADPADIRTGAVLRSQTIGVVPRALADNFEGAAVEVADGRTYLWLVSDDNFQRWQRSLLVQFELVDLPPKRTADSKKAAR
ncbi:esterase-like activity of phytase family protein [Sphingopyxis kveilinensis]|uniref:esterase-like activity of phytase family protein n=1 Tax=Sphingopyxis kveilinensis TaxID=3114367 RepID=UPI0030D1DA65